MTSKLFTFNKRMVIAMEILGVLGLCVLVSWGVLLWRLMQGPIDMDFLAARIEKTVNTEQSNFKIDVGPAKLTWQGDFSPLQLEFGEVSIRRPDDTPVMHVARMGVQLSPTQLLRGNIGVKRIKIYKPALRIIRWEDGQVTLNTEEAPGAIAPAVTEAPKTQEDVVQSLLAQLNGEGGNQAFLRGLREVSVIGAGVLFEDKVLKTSFRSRNADISFAKKRNGLAARFGIAVDMAEGGETGYIKGSLTAPRNDDQIKGNISFRGLNPARFGLTDGGVDALADINMPFKGVVLFQLDKALKPQAVKYSLAADGGVFNASELYKQPIEVTHFFMRGYADLAKKTGQVERFELRVKGGAFLQANVIAAEGEGDTRNISILGLLTKTPMNDLKIYWPPGLAPDARDWVTNHLSKGTADRATLKAELSYDPSAETKIKVNDVGGKIDFHGIRVDYFPPLKPATDAKGRATYDMKSFNLDIAGGTLDDMKVTKSTIRITDLDIQDEVTNSKIDIDIDISGPLKTALMVLDSKPLGYPKSLGIKSADVGGNADINVKFKFPLYKDLKVDEVDVKASAKLQDVLLKSMVSGMDISGGPMDLSVNNGALDIKGKGQLADMPVTFEWTKNFLASSALDMDLKADLALNGAGLAAFGVPPALAVTGKIQTNATYKLKHDGNAELVLKGDVMNAGISMPDLQLQKPVGAAGSIDATLKLKNERLLSIPKLDLQATGLTVQGSMDFDSSKPQTVLKRMNLPVIRSGKTDISVKGDYNGASGYDVTVTGRQFDASSFFPEKDPPNSDEAAAIRGERMTLSLTVQKLMTGADRGLENVKMLMNRNEWQRIDYLDMAANAGGKPLSVKYLPSGQGHSLWVDAQNAGAALTAIGITKTIRQGQLRIEGRTPPRGGGRDLQGTVLLSNFGVKDAPLMATLLNAMSLSGIQSLLNGEGVQFKKARAYFDWVDRGQPQQKANIRLLKLREGQTSGSSLGLTFEGTIDNWKNIYDINGTIIPVSDLNKMLTLVPVIGNVLTAGGEGLIAATYKIKGPKDNPSASVNPLSVLAPGILRKLFFEN